MGRKSDKGLWAHTLTKERNKGWWEKRKEIKGGGTTNMAIKSERGKLNGTANQSVKIK